MPFSTTRAGELPRVGTIDRIHSSSVTDVRTPCCMLYTKSGSVPYLTQDILNRIENLPKIAQVSLGHFLRFENNFKKYGKGLKELAHMQDYAVLCTLNDPAVHTIQRKQGYKDAVAVISMHGFNEVNVEQWASMVRALRPDMMQVLVQDSVHESHNRMKAVLIRSQLLAEDCHKLSQDEELEDTMFVGTVLGGVHSDMKKAYNREIIKNNASAYIIEGMYNYGPGVEYLDPSAITATLKSVTSMLPMNSFRILPGVLSPSLVLHALEAGIDMFDTSYPYVLSSRGCALVFNYTDGPTPVIDGSNGTHVHLKNKKFVDDLSPLLENCTCHTCKTYTRAYLNHLTLTDELLGPILLMVHNLHHYLRFFEAIRKSLEEGKYDEFAVLIRKQCSPEVKPASSPESATS